MQITLPGSRRRLLLVTVLLALLAVVATGQGQGGSRSGMFLTPKAGQAEDPILAQGKLLFQRNCAACHGETGDGQGEALKFLSPKPRNFQEAKFKLVTTENRAPTDDDLMQVITRGMPGSAMISFGHLPEQERVALVKYVRHLTRTGVEARIIKALKEAEEAVDPQAVAKDVDRLAMPGTLLTLPKDLPANDQASLARGKLLYTNQCATCHGETGRGEGGKEQKDDDGSPTKPRDFTQGIFKGNRDFASLYHRIQIGMPGTPMPASPHLKPAEIADLVHYVQSFAPADAQAKVEHKRQQLTAKRVAAITDDVWSTVPATTIVVSPLWWRDFLNPGLQVQAVHDGKQVAVRLSWKDTTKNDTVKRPEDFEDMAALQLFRGQYEPFIGMGAKDSNIDLWLWRATWGTNRATAQGPLDEYPFDTPFYKGRVQGTPPGYRTAKDAGNQNNPGSGHSASSLVAGGFGSTTFRPKMSQSVSASAQYADGRWSVVLRRPLAVPAGEGVTLEPGTRGSIAFAIWDGAAQDRNGQKLISIWHDLVVE